MTKPISSLRRRMIEDMQVRNLSPHTQRAYIEQVSRFARYFVKSPAMLGPEEIRTYQIHLANERKLAPSSIQIAIAALRFLYRVTLKKEWAFTEVTPSPKAAAKLPVVLSPDEVRRPGRTRMHHYARARASSQTSAGMPAQPTSHGRTATVPSRGSLATRCRRVSAGRRWLRCCRRG